MTDARRMLIAGEARGTVLALDEPLSFWGGFDAETGTVIDRAHPQVGASLAGRVVVMPFGRGSSSGSSVLAEAIRHLPEKERRVMPLYYERELTMKEVGALLGITESRVSQLHTQAIGRLRTLLEKFSREGLPGV